MAGLAEGCAAGDEEHQAVGDEEHQAVTCTTPQPRKLRESHRAKIVRRAKERREAEQAAAALQAMQAQQEAEAAARAAAARDMTPAVRAPVEAPSSMQEAGPIFGELPAPPYQPCPTCLAVLPWSPPGHVGGCGSGTGLGGPRACPVCR
jgi:hypothetical protein